jgi:hypothetical protein
VLSLIPCTRPCLFKATNITICENQTAALNCPNGTFINFDQVFFGRKSIESCLSQPMSISCTSPETEVYNNVRAYEHCQMKNKCWLNASISTFKDPCPGYSKYLNVVYRCTPGRYYSLLNQYDSKLSSVAGDELSLIRLLFQKTVRLQCMTIVNHGNNHGMT